MSAPIPMRTTEEVGRAFGLIGIADEVLKQADWAGAAASWRSQIEAAAMLDPTLFLQATSGRMAADMKLKLKLADAAAAFVAALADARAEAADIVAAYTQRQAAQAIDRFDGRAA